VKGRGCTGAGEPLGGNAKGKHKGKINYGQHEGEGKLFLFCDRWREGEVQLLLLWKALGGGKWD